MLDLLTNDDSSIDPSHRPNGLDVSVKFDRGKNRVNKNAKAAAAWPSISASVLNKLGSLISTIGETFMSIKLI
jgi:hypothetical protein